MLRWVVWAVALVSCGGIVGSSGGPDGGGDGGAEAAEAASPSGDAGWTTCSSPTGQMVCDGPNHCTCADGNPCPTIGAISPTAVHVCTGSAGFVGMDVCAFAPDGAVCVAPYDKSPTFFFGAHYDLGVLFANNGGADRVRYADFGLWTGEPVPTPATCPTLKFAQICGGNCGGCPAGWVCHGRSPLHPWGFCLPNNGSDACDLSKGVLCSSTGDRCFAYTVQPAAQDLANQNSVCLPTIMCQDLAANLPGGASCQ